MLDIAGDDREFEDLGRLLHGHSHLQKGVHVKRSSNRPGSLLETCNTHTLYTIYNLKL